MNMASATRQRRTVVGVTIVLITALAITASATLGVARPQLLQAVPGKPPAPDFSLPDLDGELTRLSDLKGKVVIVNFWATWCPPCRFEIPSMQRAWIRLRDKGVMMLAVHLGGNKDKIWAFATEYDVEFPVLIDKTSSTATAWRTFGLPTTYVVDPEGRMALRAIGGREWDDPALIDAILALAK